MQYLQYVTGIVCLVMAIWVIVKCFQTGHTTQGIIGIVGLLLCCCPGYLFTLVYGWMKAKEWNFTVPMAIYTAAFVLNIILGVAFPDPNLRAQLSGAGVPVVTAP